MAHPEMQGYLSRIRERYPQHFWHVRVLDCGSRDINGTNRDLWTLESGYTGIDIVNGPNVNLVLPMEDADWCDEHFHVCISTEVLEHNPKWREGIKNMVRMLAPGGLLIVTCATTGRLPHMAETGYYQNLTEADIRTVIDEGLFETVEYEVNEDNHDLYFHAVKKGELTHGCNDDH